MIQYWTWAAILAFISVVVQGNDQPNFTHDPALVRREDGTYFRFSTLDLIGIWKAQDLAGPWTRSGSVITGASIIDMDGKDVLWAPDVTKVNGIYHLFYSVSTSSSQTSAIGYATSKSLDNGTWTDHGAVLKSDSSKPYNAIDPNLVKAGDQWYLQWGSYWGGIYQSEVKITDCGNVSLAGDEHQIAYNPEGNHPLEGAFVFPHDSFFFLFLSKGICCNYDPLPPEGTEYHITVCRSENATGPYVGPAGKACNEGGGAVVLASHGDVYAPGGQGVYGDPALGEIFYYHYLNFSEPDGLEYKNAKFGWGHLKWVDGWPQVGA